MKIKHIRYLQDNVQVKYIFQCWIVALLENNCSAISVLILVLWLLHGRNLVQQDQSPQVTRLWSGLPDDSRFLLWNLLCGLFQLAACVGHSSGIWRTNNKIGAFAMLLMWRWCSWWSWEPQCGSCQYSHPCSEVRIQLHTGKLGELTCYNMSMPDLGLLPAQLEAKLHWFHVVCSKCTAEMLGRGAVPDCGGCILDIGQIVFAWLGLSRRSTSWSMVQLK